MNRMPPRISIVIPNYNSALTLDRTLQSLAAQSYFNLQLIFMDSQSTDDSVEIVQRYRPLFDKIIVEKDAGQADGLNRGFRHADGDIFAWLCSDDELTPGALQHVAELFEKNPKADVITGACHLRFPDGTHSLHTPHPDPWSVIAVQNSIQQPSTFWRASLHRKLGDLAPHYNLAFDWDWWIRMRNAGATIVTTPRPLSTYHFSATNKTGTAGRQFRDEAFQILRQYGPRGGDVAYVYRFLYNHFDLKGCYDKPPTCTLLRSHAFISTLAALRLVIGKRLLYLYNWHFASCQERGLKWWA